MIQSPRASAMGEGGTGLYDDLLGALNLNPAALGRTRYSELAFTYNSWLEDISMQQIAYAQPLSNKSVLAASLSLLEMNSFSGYDNSGGYVGAVDAGDMAVSLNYAKRISGTWDDLRFGVFMGGGVKYAREVLDNFSADTLLFDAGFLSISQLSGGVLGLGVSAQSLGGGFKFNSVKDNGPSVLRAGASWTLPAWGDPLTLAVDLKKPNDDKTTCSAGLEYVVNGLISGRLGYAGGADLGSGVRFGMGFKLKVIQVDYAMAKYGEFGYTHKFGVSYKFGAPVEVTPYLTPQQEKARWKLNRAKAFMRENSYYEAVLELNDALTLEPTLKEALQLMKQAREIMETEKSRNR
ncbi:MAG: PorV/PorQ family protein [Elusimicrobia bacterium]|nr:PorV/PorQ family protein [Elusimicrobiota bacterium]